MLLPGKPYEGGRQTRAVPSHFERTEHFDSKDGPPTGLHPLLFAEPQPFDEYKLQRLSPATDFYRSLIGVRHGAHEGLQIWGIVHSGPRGLHYFY